MTKCAKCGSESPKQFVSVKTAKEQYSQCKTCGFIPEKNRIEKIEISLKGLKTVKPSKIELPIKSKIAKKKTEELSLRRIGLVKKEGE